MQVAYNDTGGVWRPWANPFGGSPLLEYISDGTPEGTDERPYGVAMLTTEPDMTAFQIAAQMFNGLTLEQAKAPFVVFQGPLKVVQGVTGPVSIDSLDQAQQDYYNNLNAVNAKKAADAITVLQTGKWQSTGAGAGSQVLRDPGAPPPSPNPPGLVTTVADPPASTGVVTHDTVIQLAKVAPAFIPGIDSTAYGPNNPAPASAYADRGPFAVLRAITPGGATDVPNIFGNQGLTPDDPGWDPQYAPGGKYGPAAPPATTPAVNTTVTGGVAGAARVSSSAVPDASGSAASGAGGGTPAPSSKATIVVAVLAIATVLAFVFAGSSSGGAS